MKEIVKSESGNNAVELELGNNNVIGPEFKDFEFDYYDKPVEPKSEKVVEPEFCRSKSNCVSQFSNLDDSDSDDSDCSKYSSFVCEDYKSVEPEAENNDRESVKSELFNIENNVEPKLGNNNVIDHEFSVLVCDYYDKSVEPKSEKDDSGFFELIED